MRRGTFAIILSCLALAGCGQETSSPESPKLVERTVSSAPITGVLNPSGVIEFRGIPYAKAPIGDLRWRAPQPMDLGDAPIDATQFGPACPQGQGNPNWYRTVVEGFDGSASVIPELEDISEDCLTLNIWTKADGGEAQPVMVWIHGGSNVNGFSHEPNYLGHQLADRGVVVVSLNYRMGAFGFLPHALLEAEDPDGVSGYYGLADQVAALKWVQAHISDLGGDPANVTVFGESAGGGDISALLRMPSAKGLFHKAIIQSGALAPYDAIAYDTAKQAGNALFSALNAGTIEDLRALSWEQVIDQAPDALPDYYFGPVVDGKHFPDTAIINRVPLVIGANADEMLMYLPKDDPDPVTSALGEYDRSKLQDIQSYFGGVEISDQQKANALSSASAFFCPALGLAQQAQAAGAPVYPYYFTRMRPGGEALGAYHGAEIPYVFDTADAWLPAADADLELTATMSQYWLNFARSGNPNGSGLPQWSPFTGAAGPFQELGEQVGPTRKHPAALCPFLTSSN